jgi:catechol 2,3-dioxygenase-like lactoylglutathione lyase family enzyme
MDSTQVKNETAIRTPIAQPIEMKIEVVVIPVSDVDHAKRFYTDLGWRLDLDITADEEYRVIQFTPPGSCQRALLRCRWSIPPRQSEIPDPRPATAAKQLRFLRVVPRSRR